MIPQKHSVFKYVSFFFTYIISHYLRSGIFNISKNNITRGDVLSEEFENSTKCEHRICLDKYRMG